jgi:RNA polymerase sigma-70 factor (ECF subfamily)
MARSRPLTRREAPLTDDRSDDELIREVVGRGGEPAFRLLYRRHTPALFRMALRLLGGDTSHAEDVIQDVWVRAVARLPEFRRDSSLRTWLTGFVINCCRESRRRDSRRETGLREGPPEALREPMAPAAMDLERAIAGLAEGYRRVLVLHDVMGYTHREIAGLLGVEEGTSKSQLFLARRAVRRRLANGQGSEGSDA